MNALLVQAPGLATIQDLGRPGHRAAGIAPSGAFDGFAHAAANALVGNPEEAAALEIAVLGPKLVVQTDLTIALTGADLSATVDGSPCPRWRAVGVRRGQTIAFGRRAWGCRATLAVSGGLDAPVFLGSRSADLRAGLGPARLATGQVLALAGRPRRHRTDDLTARAAPVYEPAELRLVPGPEADWFEPEALDVLLSNPFAIRPDSDRSSLRLAGPALRRRAGELLSVPVTCGHVQVPPDGQPIVLGPECQSIGGYPRIGCVIAADRPRLAQAFPGESVRFSLLDVEAARWLLSGQRALLD